MDYKAQPGVKPDQFSLRQWLVTICSVRFDLEQGQILEEAYPPGLLSHEEELDVAFNSFPDSFSRPRNQGVNQDTVFFFRIRRHGNLPLSTCNLSKFQSFHDITTEGSLDHACPDGKCSISEEDMHEGTHEASEISRSLSCAKSARHDFHRTVSHCDAASRSRGERYLYGFVFNRQKQDRSLKRGGEQKSVVILSNWPFYSVFGPLVEIAGPLFFEMGSKALEHIMIAVSCWPPPSHGSPMTLCLGSAAMQVHLPPLHSLPPGHNVLMDGFTCAMAPITPLKQSIPHGIFHEVDLFKIFKGLLTDLWTLWELLLIGKSLLVISPTPSQCSEAVAALVSLIAPLPCSIDFRPYFTIHDPDFKAFTSFREGEQGTPMILGVTNFFFLKAIKSLPSVLSIGAYAHSPSKGMRHDQNSFKQQTLPLLQLKQYSPSNLLIAAKLKKDGPISLMNKHREALWTDHKAVTKPDISILNRLVNASPSLGAEESMSVVNNEILRRHFLELTINFLAPFGPYLRPNTPQEGMALYMEPPPLPPFEVHNFLEGLSRRGPGKFLSKRLNGTWLDLYKQFLKGPNFMPWFQRRRAVAEKEQQRIWWEARLKADIPASLSKMTEVEMIETFNFVGLHLNAEIQKQHAAGLEGIDSVVARNLRHELKIIYDVLPSDLQQLLFLNPHHAALLQAEENIMNEAMLGQKPKP